MSKCTIVVQRVVKEEYQMSLETDTAMQAFDQVQQLVQERNAKSTTGKYAIIKVKKEE